MSKISGKSGQYEIKLLNRVAAKDEKAFEELYDMYSNLCFRIIYRITHDRLISEELLQNVFIKIWDSASHFNADKGSVYSWISSITRNQAIDKIRSKSFRDLLLNKDTLEEPADPDHNNGGHGLNNILKEETAKLVTSAMNSIPVEQRLVIELSFFEGLTHIEISQALEVPLGTVKTRMRQGLIKLHKLLDGME